MSDTLNLNRFKLKIITWEYSGKGQTRVRYTRIRFIITDESLSDSYPTNYYCHLPEFFNKTSKCKLIALVGIERAKELTKQLLEEAFLTETDPEVKKEIEYRLKRLQPS